MFWFVTKKKYEALKKQHEDELEKISQLVDTLEKRIQNNRESVKNFSDDLAEAKKQIDSWKEPNGLIVQYEGIVLIQEIIDKLLQRLDFYYISDEQEYPTTGLPLQYTKENYYKNAKEKTQIFTNIINSRKI